MIFHLQTQWGEEIKFLSPFKIPKSMLHEIILLIATWTKGKNFHPSLYQFCSY